MTKTCLRSGETFIKYIFIKHRRIQVNALLTRAKGPVVAAGELHVSEIILIDTGLQMLESKPFCNKICCFFTIWQFRNWQSSIELERERIIPPRACGVIYDIGDVNLLRFHVRFHIDLLDLRMRPLVQGQDAADTGENEQMDLVVDTHDEIACAGMLEVA